MCMKSSKLLLVAVFIVLCTTGFGCSKQEYRYSGDRETDFEAILSVDSDGLSTVDELVWVDNILAMERERIDRQEKNDLRYVRELEKMAFDLYMGWSERWGLPMYTKGYKAELSHTKAVAVFLEIYDIKDKAHGEVGSFEYDDILEKYNDRHERGMVSSEEAIRLTAEIQEELIVFLEQLLVDGRTDNMDIEVMYNNLIRASRNHFRLAVRHINRNGGSYSPIHLPEGMYKDIISNDIEYDGVGQLYSRMGL